MVEASAAKAPTSARAQAQYSMILFNEAQICWVSRRTGSGDREYSGSERHPHTESTGHSLLHESAAVRRFRRGDSHACTICLRSTFSWNLFHPGGRHRDREMPRCDDKTAERLVYKNAAKPVQRGSHLSGVFATAILAGDFTRVFGSRGKTPLRHSRSRWAQGPAPGTPCRLRQYWRAIIFPRRHWNSLTLLWHKLKDPPLSRLRAAPVSESDIRAFQATVRSELEATQAQGTSRQDP